MTEINRIKAQIEELQRQLKATEIKKAVKDYKKGLDNGETQLESALNALNGTSLSIADLYVGLQNSGIDRP